MSVTHQNLLVRTISRCQLPRFPVWVVVMIIKCFALLLLMLVMCKTDSVIMCYCVAKHFCALVSMITSVWTTSLQ